MAPQAESAPYNAAVLDGTPYRAVALLGAGGMGEIYEAIGPFDRESIVVKVLRAELTGEPELIDRMRIEGETLELLSHPNIVVSRGHGSTAEGRPYVAMERLVGCTLQQELRRRGAMPLGVALHYMRQLLGALEAVHDAGVVHRDVKPGNVMLCGGEREKLKLLDFGVAKVRDGSGRFITPLSFPTQAGLCVGTPRYVSPEQARGEEVDLRTDIYAAGIILYTLVAGRGPFDEIKGAGQILQAHIAKDPPLPSNFSPAPVPTRLESVILRAIAKNPADRFSDVASFGRELTLAAARICVSLARRLGDGEVDTAQVTVVAPRFDEVPTVLVPGAPLASASGVSMRSRGALGTQPVSRSGVFLSAAAFFAVASGLAMWFVR